MNNRQLNLPADPYNLQWPEVPLSMNRPPLVPNYQGPHWMLGIVPDVAAALAIEIQANAFRRDTNPLRIFMFNLFAEHQFNNELFADLVINTCDFIACYVNRGRWQDPGVALPDAVRDMVEMVAASHVRRFQDLEFTLDRGLLNAAYELIAQLDTIAREVEGWMNGGPANHQRGYEMDRGGYNQPRARVYQGAQGGGYGGGYGGRRTYQGAGGQRGGSSMSDRFGGQGTPASTPGSQLYNRVAPNQPPASGGSFSGRYDNNQPRPNPLEPDQLLTPPSPRQETNEMQSNSNQLQEGQILSYEEGLKLWMPTEQIPYLPAFDPTKHKLIFQFKDGQVRPNMMKVSDEMLDYDRHNIKTIFGEVPKVLDLSKPQDVAKALEEGVNEINSVKTVEGEETPQLSQLIDQRTPLETSIEAAWANSAVSRLALVASGEKVDIFRSYACVVSPIITVEDESEFLEELSQARTYLEVRDFLVEQAKLVSLEMFSTVERRLTKKINDILKYQLSLADLSIDSFVSDIEELLGVLRESYGEMIYGAFVKNQRRYIANLFQRLDAEAAKGLTEMLLGDRTFTEDNPAPFVQHLSQVVTLTHLDCSIHELNLDFGPDLAAVVVQRFFPAFHAVLDTIVKASQHEARIGRNLLRTNDGFVLEVFVGDLAGGHYVIHRAQ